MRKFKLIRRALPTSLPLRGPLPEEITARGAPPVTRNEFAKEGAHLRDLIADIYQELARLGVRVHEFERQMREWKEHLL